MRRNSRTARVAGTMIHRAVRFRDCANVAAPSGERMYDALRHKPGKTLLLLGLAVLVSACGADRHAGGASGSGTSGAVKSVADSDLVTAVGGEGSTSLIGLKFKIESRPQVGQPVQILLALT